MNRKNNGDFQESKLKDTTKAITNGRASIIERKSTLQQDVGKLKKKLRHEQNVHRAFKRAFTRPLGVLPRLPPYLPPYTLELLAEVAVLEEEVIQLEKQVVHLRKDLYQEAVYISFPKRNMENNSAHLHDLSLSPQPEKFKLSAPNLCNSAKNKSKHMQCYSDDIQEKENHSCINSLKNEKGVSNHKGQAITVLDKRPPTDHKSAEKQYHADKKQLQSRITDHENADIRASIVPDNKISEDNSPNRISENVVMCLSSILLRMSSMKNRGSIESLLTFQKLGSHAANETQELRDPYDICAEFGQRDIGPYKQFVAIDVGSINLNRTASSFFLLSRLKILLGKLVSVNLKNLTHQEKLAFWINIYNSCMMNAFLEHGIPESSEMVVAMMQKATIKVGGQLLNAITIQHSILRLPYHSKDRFSKGAKHEEKVVRSIFGLELSEPLATFALSCGSWSSPAVRVYTASQVENELEIAKRDYLQAAIGISSNKFAIPKLLNWYLLDFAKDIESLLDWICLQLPSELRKEAFSCIEKAKIEDPCKFVQIMPYEFSFRYILCL